MFDSTTLQKFDFGNKGGMEITDMHVSRVRFMMREFIYFAIACFRGEDKSQGVKYLN